MFSSLLFKQILCPNGAGKCKLANCLFSHDQPVVSSKVEEVSAAPASASVGRENGDLKRRRLNDSSIERTPAVSDADGDDEQASTMPVTLTSSASSTPTTKAAGQVSITKRLSSTTRSISPPTTSQATSRTTTAKSTAGKTTTQPPKKPAKVEQLTPRMVKSGGPFQQRLALLKVLHAELVRLNTGVKQSKDESISGLQKSDAELVIMALDREEEANAKGSALYRGLMTQKVAYYKKMNQEGWLKELRIALEKETRAVNGTTTAKGAVKIETGLTHAEEIQMLERFVLSPQQMALAGFILTAPTEDQMVEARKTEKDVGGYENCDRCGTRFRVLAEAKDGTFTTGGRCVFHWGKPQYPQRQKVDHMNTVKEAFYTCCNQPKGSPGCSTQNSHVFKIGSNWPGRLASILQFETTPLNTKAEQLAIAFDCEMGYTTAGLEVIRLSACKWPSNEALIDVLVKPIGTILDLNTKFSGVTPRQFTEAILYKLGDEAPPLPTTTTTTNADGTTHQLMKIVASPAAARDLLTSYISPTTPLIGHAIDNDLNVLRLLHPTIVDTSLLFPHHGGLPYRFPLRKLAKDFLGLEIQATGAAGHDSMEDSRATGDLVRVKVQREWEKLRRQGWSVDAGRFYAMIGGVKREAGLPVYTESQGSGRKRKGEAFALTGQVGEPVALTELMKERESEKEKEKEREAKL